MREDDQDASHQNPNSGEALLNKISTIVRGFARDTSASSGKV